MKKLFLIPCLLITISFISGQPREPLRDTLPPPSQIDSIVVYSGSHVASGEIYRSIGDLRNHIDSLNEKSYQFHTELASITWRNDSITHANQKIMIDRDRLKDSNKILNAELNILKKYPDYLMLLMIVIAGTLIGQGIRKSYINWKRDV